MFAAITEHGITARAHEQGIITLRCFNPRNYSEDKHRRVDDRPYGGGPGMVMMAPPLERALSAARAWLPNAPLYYLGPQGKPFNQQMAREFKKKTDFIFLAGRYEGIDQRFLDMYVDGYISLGDFVLTGGELAAMAIIDAITRLLPGSLGNSESAEFESFTDNLLDHPHYTRPAEYHGQIVPAVLQQGNHDAIKRFRKEAQIKMTKQFRPDLLKRH